MNSYFLCVTQPSNAGDLLINRMLIEELSRYGKVFVDCYNCPDDFRSLLIGKSDYIVDVYKTYGFTLKKGAVIPFAKLVRVNKIGLYTQSPGPLNKIKSFPLRLGLTVIRKTLSILNISFIRIGNCCSAAIATNTNVIEDRNVQYYVRSRSGVEFLRQFKKNEVHYIPDLAYLYRDHVKTRAKEKIAVMSFREVSENYDLFFNWLKDCIDLLKSKGYRIIFYHQVKNDIAFMNQLHQCIHDSSIELRKNIVWYDKFDFYANKEIVISNRLHCLLMGAVYNAVPYAYVDNSKLVRKIQDVFESSMGESSSFYIVDISSNEKLKEILDKLSTHQTTISNIVNDNANICRKTINSIILTRNK